MFGLRHLSLSLLAVGVIAPMSWGSYMTSFESPTFTAGNSPSGKDSWSASGTNPHPSVTSAQHSGTGSQSILIPKNTSASSGITRIFTSSESTTADNGLTFDFMPGTGSAAGNAVAWFYVFADDGDAANTGYIQYYLVNASSAPGATPVLQYHPAGTSTWSYLSIPAGAWTNEQWNTMQVTLDSTHQTFGFSINGKSIANDLSIATAGNGHATRFSKFWAYEINSNDLYIDNVRVSAVPEPASLVLLGLSGAALFMRRRRG
jgi:hypothetical protein